MKGFFWVILLVALPVASVNAALVEGRVVFGEKPLAGMQVRAFENLNPGSERVGDLATTAEDGSFRLDVPAGYLALYAYSADGRYFAVCGRNPLLAVDGETIWAGMQAVEVKASSEVDYADEYSAGLDGVVTLGGKPQADVFVSLYLDTAEDLKGQGYRISMPTDATGYFSFDGLPESDYFLMARKRQSGARVGPLLEGDLFGVYAGNPLNLKAGKLVSIELPLLERQPGNSAAEGPDRQGDILLRGRIVDEKGQPQAGLHFFAYRNPVIGHQRPAALSPPSDAEGKFEVSFREPGLYYVGARQEYGDSPAPGELFGLYEGRADHGLDVAEKKNPEILIRVAPISLD